MYSRNNVITTISLIGALVFAVTTAPAVSPPPDGGYLNQNTAEGQDALFSLTTGLDNTAVGFEALFGNTGGGYNTAVGAFALASNVGGFNTAVGYQALARNASSQNTAVGWDALGRNTTGANNTATGTGALEANTLGGNCTAVGVIALWRNTTGSSNTAFGYGALSNSTTGGNNIAVGNYAGSGITIGSNNIEIGNVGVSAESNTIRVGSRGTQTATYIAGISGMTIAGGVGVLIDGNGHLGTNTSSARFKDQIKPMDKTSEAILELKPVTFRYKHDLDPAGIPQFGLVAEEVEKVNPGLVARDEQGRPYTVRYEAVNAMLLNEFLKEHRKVETQEATIAEVKATVAKQDQTITQQRKEFRATVERQQKDIIALTAALKAQSAQIQKVSEQLRTQALASRVVANN